MRFFIFLVSLQFVFSPQVFGAEARSYRWFPKDWKPLPFLLSASIDKVIFGKKPVAPLSVALGDLAKNQTLVKGAGEFISRGVQSIGSAKIDDTWTQTIFHRDGHVIYASGRVYEGLDDSQLLVRVNKMRKNLGFAANFAAEMDPSFRRSSLRYPIAVRIGLNPEGILEPYWRVEYLSEDQERVFFISLSENGKLMDRGMVPTAAADGKALVFPQGPKWSRVTEVALRDLLGDGTLTHPSFRITSLQEDNVRSPNLQFFYPESDRRFDMAQAYFTLETSLRWMREKLGASLKSPLEVRLHIGNNGISNAAFYHSNIIYLGCGDGITYRDLARDPSVIIHESIHAMIDTYTGLPSQGEGGSLNEGFADFFTALVLRNPRMGESSYVKGPYRRTLENKLKAYQDFTGLYQSGSVIGATLWDLRSFLPEDRLANLAFKTLVRLGPGAGFGDFVPALLHASSAVLDAREQEQLVLHVRDRGWVISP